MNKRELAARREDLLRLCCKGVPAKNAAEEMSKNIEDPAEQKRSVDRVVQDWQRRRQWMPQLARLQDPTLLPELIVGMLEIRKSAWTQYASGDNSSAKVGALKVALQTYKEIVEVLQSIGAIERLPLETTLTIASTPFDADPQMKRLLLEAAAKQRQEKAPTSNCIGSLCPAANGPENCVTAKSGGKCPTFTDDQLAELVQQAKAHAEEPPGPRP